MFKATEKLELYNKTSLDDFNGSYKGNSSFDNTFLVGKIWHIIFYQVFKVSLA